MEVRQEAGAAAVLDPEIKMEEEEEEGAVDPEEGEPKEGTALPRTAGSQVKEELEDETPGNWDARLQEFLKTLQAPLPSAGKTSQQPERKPCRDPKRSPVPSQGTRGANKEPKGLWVSPKELTFPGDAGQEPSAHLDAASLGKERGRGLPASPAKAEMQRQRFRTLRYQDASGPREVCRQLRERCREWLEPEKHSKEQMLELVTLEQFLAVLPPEVQGWVEGRGPGSCAEAVTLAEEFLRRQPEAKVRELQVTGLNEEHGADSPAAREALPNQEKPQLPTEKDDGRKGNGSMPEDRRLREKEERRPLVGIPEQRERPMAWMKTGHEGDFWSQGEAEENQHKAEGSKGEAGATGLDRPGQPQVACEGVTRPATLEEEEEEEENWVKDDPSGEDPPLMAPEDPEGEEKPFRCWHCGKSFNSSVKLVTHERTHVGEKLYTCSSCGESERTHTVQKPHKCSRCGNTFGWNPQERLPGGEKPYTCSECGKSCSQRSDFLKHQRTHTGEHKREQQDHKAERPREMKREPEEEAPPSEEPRKKQKLTMETRSVGSVSPEPERRPPEPDRTPSLCPLSSAGTDLPLTSKEQEEYAAALIYVMGTDFINRHGEAGRFVYSLCKRRVGGSQTWVPGWIHYRCKKLILFHCAESTKKPKSKLKCFHLGNITRRLAIHQRECAPMELCPCLTNLQEIHLRRMVHDWAHQYEHESQPGSLDSPPRTSQQAQELEQQGHQEEE